MNVLTEVDRAVLLSYADNNMNMSATARDSYLCRGSVEYHLNRVRQKTGLDPFKFHDLVELIQRTYRPAKTEG